MVTKSFLISTSQCGLCFFWKRHIVTKSFFLDIHPLMFFFWNDTLISFNCRTVQIDPSTTYTLSNLSLRYHIQITLDIRLFFLILVQRNSPSTTYLSNLSLNIELPRSNLIPYRLVWIYHWDWPRFGLLELIMTRIFAMFTLSNYSFRDIVRRRSQT